MEIFFLYNRYCRVNDRILELEKQHEEVSDINKFFSISMLSLRGSLLIMISLMSCYNLLIYLCHCQAEDFNCCVFKANVSFMFQRVDVIRRSYRQQLADAITQIANQHQVHTQI